MPHVTKEDLHLIIKRVWLRNNGGEQKYVDSFLEKPGIEGTLIVQSKNGGNRKHTS